MTAAAHVSIAMLLSIAACSDRGGSGGGKVGRVGPGAEHDAAPEDDTAPTPRRPLTDLVRGGRVALPGPLIGVAFAEPTALVRSRLADPGYFTEMGKKQATWGGGWTGTRFALEDDPELGVVVAARVVFGQRRGVRDALVKGWGVPLEAPDGALVWVDAASGIQARFRRRGARKVLELRPFVPATGISVPLWVVVGIRD
jgi:hypothetical protein